MEALTGPERQAVVDRLARVLSAVGRDLGERPLVLPNGEFFPDRFSGDAESVARLVGRMQTHAGMGDIPLTTHLVAPEEDPAAGCGTGGCGSGACHVPARDGAEGARLVDLGDAWRLNVPAEEVSHPVVLTTLTARALGTVFLAETLQDGTALEDPPEIVAEHVAAGLGFGPLLLEGSYIYSKGCGGPQVTRVTATSLPELSLVVALLAEMRGQPLRRAFAELGTTQAAVLRESHAWVRESKALVVALREAPELVLTGGYEDFVRASREGSRASKGPAWKRWLGLGGAAAQAPAPAAPRPERAKAPDELRDLVGEALAEARAQQG
jgi:hypothetical protein